MIVGMTMVVPGFWVLGLVVRVMIVCGHEGLYIETPFIRQPEATIESRTIWSPP
jgi:hypothetical protein